MKPQRIQLSRKKGWRLPPNTVVVSRPSRWGNPFKVSDFIDNFGFDKSRSQKECVRLYGEHLNIRNLHTGGQTYNNISSSLKGKNLARWCKLGTPCHADVLLEIANGGGND